MAAQPPSSGETGLTPHDIYQRDAPGVVFVRAQIIQQVQDPFDVFPHAYLGADGVPAPGSQHGVILRSVQRGSPAAQAGLMPGDEIIALAGRRVATISDVLQIVDAHLPGQTITIRSRRGDRVQRLAVKLGSKSETAPQ